MRNIFVSICILFWANAGLSQNMICHLETICEQKNECRDVGPIELPLSETETGYDFVTPLGAFSTQRVNPEIEDIMMLLIPFQHGVWGTFSIFPNGTGVFSQSGLQNGEPYSSRAFATCEVDE